MVALAMKILRLIAVTSILVGLMACSAPSGSKSATAIPIIPTPSLASIPSCASNEFELPESVLRTGEVLEHKEVLLREFDLDQRLQQYGWLSVHLDLTQNIVRYGDPIPFRIMIANETEHPVIFVRPKSMTFAGCYNYPTQIRFDMVSTQGTKIKPRSIKEILAVVHQPKETFSMLLPRQSCIMDLELRWDKTCPPLEEPIPAGVYRLKVILKGTGLGPDAGYGRIIDVGGWIGWSESNVVTLTIVPE